MTHKDHNVHSAQNAQDLRQRYIYQVVRRLPESQRAEVRLELQELLDDMLEQGKSLEEVLTELGDPAAFAANYREDVHYLIGPEYYDTYLWFVKVVLLCTLIPVVAVSVIASIRAGLAVPAANYVQTTIDVITAGLIEALTSGLTACAGAFGAVTLVFAVMERQKIKIDLKKGQVRQAGDCDAASSSTEKTAVRGWTPQDLVPVPQHKAVISRGDSIVSIIFIVIFCVLLIMAPQFFAVIFPSNGSVVSVPLFNLAKWSVILPVVIASLLLGLADEILRLVTGVYCRLVMVSSIICGAIQIMLGVIVLQVLPFWNPDFARQLQLKLSAQPAGSSAFWQQLAENWSAALASNVLLSIIIIVTLAEIGTTVYKTWRYGTEMVD